MSGQQGRQLRKSSAPPDMQQVVLLVIWVLAQVALEAVGQTKDGELAGGAGLTQLPGHPSLKIMANPESAGLGHGQAATC